MVGAPRAVWHGFSILLSGRNSDLSGMGSSVDTFPSWHLLNIALSHRESDVKPDEDWITEQFTMAAFSCSRTASRCLRGEFPTDDGC